MAKSLDSTKNISETFNTLDLKSEERLENQDQILAGQEEELDNEYEKLELKLKPPSMGHERPAIFDLGNYQAQYDAEQQNTENENAHNKTETSSYSFAQEISDTPIKTNVCVKGDWDLAQDKNQCLDQGEEL